MSKENKLYIITLTFLCAASILTFFMVEWMQGVCPNPIRLNFWLNLLVYFGLSALIYGLTRRVMLCAIIPTVIFGLLGAVNHFMLELRNKALLPWDIFALSTAQNVAGGLSLSWDISLVAAIIALVIITVGAWRLRHVRFPGRSRMIASLIGVGFLSSIWLILWYTPGSISSDQWNTASASKQNGMAVNLVHNTKTLINLPPEGYSVERVREIVGDGAREGEMKPDIIVIMDETFADLSTFADLQIENDPIPFIRSLTENTIRGTARVSVFGGGTCNTEYDFLTGNSSMMLRAGSYPMAQFVTEDAPSLASSLRNNGYRTIGIHPFHPNGWNRDRAYPKLGFDKFYSIDDFENPELVREYVSDAESFRKVLSVLDESEQPAFIFNVTMQNHCGYDDSYDNFEENAKFPEAEQFPQTRRYLSLLSYTDRAVEQLIGQLKERERPTIVLFFGDHLPAIENEYYELLQERGNISGDRMEELRTTVPFFIWANFPIEERADIHTSVSFLAPLLLDAAKAPMTAHQNYLFNLMQSVPILKNDGSDAMQEYRIVSHNMVFDTTDRQNDLFQ